MQHEDTLPPHLVILRYWHRLIQAVGAGTAAHTTSLARWIPPTVIAERDRQARIERAERTALALGERPVPVDLDAVTTVMDVTAAVLTVEDTVRRQLGLTLWERDDRNPMTVPAACNDLDVLGRLMTPEQRARVGYELRPSSTAVLHAVGLDPTPMVLRHPCPGCGGRLLLVTTHRLGEHVRCDGDVDRHCTAVSRHRVWGRPIWGVDEFPALGQLLDDGYEPTPVGLVDADEQERRARVATVVPPTGDPGGRTIAGVTDAA